MEVLRSEPLKKSQDVVNCVVFSGGWLVYRKNNPEEFIVRKTHFTNYGVNHEVLASASFKSKSLNLYIRYYDRQTFLYFPLMMV